MRPLVALLLSACAALADDFASQLDPADFRLAAVLEQGRKKPLDTLARERLELITGNCAYKGQDPVATLLSMVFDRSGWMEAEIFDVSFPQLVESIGKRKDGNVYSAKEILASAALMAEIEKRESRKNGPRETALAELRAKLTCFLNLGAMLRVVPPPAGYPKDDWYGMREAAPGTWRAEGAPRDLYPAGWVDETEKLWGQLAAAVRAKDATAANRAMAALAPRLASVSAGNYPSRSMLAAEHAFMRWQPFRWSWILYALACGVLGFGVWLGSKRWHTAGFVLMCAGFASHLMGAGMRAYVAQRAPWADLYETMVAATLMCTVFAVCFEAIFRSSYVGISACFMGAVGLVGASMLPFDFRTVDPLVPELRSWWLKYHVLAMICAYGAFTLAFGISVLHLWVHFGRKDEQGSKKLEDLTYRIIQIGFFSITLGVILGALWADSAWGRYWGWDPKETWALVTWFIYAACIHGRMLGWCRGPRAAAASILGYAAALFTFFGVNFLMTGLHSYANAT